MKNYLKNFLAWLCRIDPQGLGTLLVGIAAILAACQSSGVLDKILKIQKQARSIEAGVAELRHQSTQISNAVSLLGYQLKEIKAQKTVNASEALKKLDSSKKQIENAIRALPSRPIPGESFIYLPEKHFGATVDLIYKAETSNQRVNILQRAFNYRPILEAVDLKVKAQKAE